MPKPLSESVHKGLAYLVNQQHSNGGWGQGGGWRTGGHGGRVEGANVEDPADVASTCMATLALLRSGSTPQHGPYAKNIARAVDFICSHVEKSDRTSLFVTDVRDTQIQVKIGPYVDTFLTALVFAELKGQMATPASENRLTACLGKTIGKIESNQKDDGTFAGNNGWASVFSQGLAGKALNRAKQNGWVVNDKALARAEKNAELAVAAPASIGGIETRAGRGALASAGHLSASYSAPAMSAGPSDAGVPIYSRSNNLVSLQQAINTEQAVKEQARSVLASKSASLDDRKKARADLERIGRIEQTQKDAVADVVKQLGDKRFIQGFGSNGGEEFLSYLNISETLVARGGKEWTDWDRTIAENLERVQNDDGSWSGNHCITGRTVCTSAALLVLMADRTPVPVAAKEAHK
jgi:hypothetical protein